MRDATSEGPIVKRHSVHVKDIYYMLKTLESMGLWLSGWSSWFWSRQILWGLSTKNWQSGFHPSGKYTKTSCFAYTCMCMLGEIHALSWSFGGSSVGTWWGWGPWWWCYKTILILWHVHLHSFTQISCLGTATDANLYTERFFPAGEKNAQSTHGF